MNKSIASFSYSFILLGVLHTTSFPFSKLDMFRYSPPPAKVHYFSYHQKTGEKWKKEGKKKSGKLHIIVWMLLWSKHCKFSSNYFRRTTFSSIFIATHAYFTLLLLCWLWVDGVWLFQNSYWWVGSRISSGLRKKPCLYR